MDRKKHLASRDTVSPPPFHFFGTPACRLDYEWDGPPPLPSQSTAATARSELPVVRQESQRLSSSELPRTGLERSRLAADAFACIDTRLRTSLLKNGWRPRYDQAHGLQRSHISMSINNLILAKLPVWQDQNRFKFHRVHPTHGRLPSSRCIKSDRRRF